MAERESTSRRQYLRELCLENARRYIKKNHGGTGASGGNIWPFSRRQRRSMEHDRARHEFSDIRSQTVLHKAQHTVESER